MTDLTFGPRESLPTLLDRATAALDSARTSAEILEARDLARVAYDAAQERGEVRRPNNEKTASGEEAVSASDLHLTHKDIHEARRLRDAEAADPGAVRRALDGMIERGEEPTRAALKREVIDRPAPVPQRVMDPKALWLWGRLKDFSRMEVLGSDPAALLNEMTEPMREEMRSETPKVREFLAKLEALL